MKRPRISMLATLCAMALASAGANAHDPYPGVEGHDLPAAGCGAMGQWPYGPFASVDLNGDGFIDRTEVVAGSPWYPYFTPMDANGDGRITLAESNAYTSAYRPDRWPYGTFVQVDSNGDGYIDRTEVVETSPWHPYFNPMDANHDGRVTRGEAEAYTASWRPGPWPNWSFVGVDSNHDGYIDRTEVVATSPMHPHFDQIDSNDDSRATPEEVETFWRTMAHAGGSSMDCQHMVAHDAGADAPRDISDKGHPPSFRSSDKNGDGFLSRDELSEGDMLLGHFAAADINNDGRLSAGEVDAHKAAMAEMGKRP
jgi:Ca2+-binding EF-hand superfamily protein